MEPITTTAELAALCARLSLEPFIAVDTEFMRETTYYPKLCLIQVAGPDEAAVVDPLAEGLDLKPLLDLLADPTLLKVFHAGRQDVEIFNNLGVMPEPIFDSQIAAMAAGFGEQIAYDALMRQLLRVEIDKSSRFTDWARRPLSAAQITYALGDVVHLAAAFRSCANGWRRTTASPGSARKWPTSPIRPTTTPIRRTPGSG
jgi:ribonuclease D